MKENLEEIIRNKMSGYAEKAPDLKQSIFDKMDARMSGEQFEAAVKDKLTNYSAKAPNVLERIFAVRNSWFIARNRLILGFEKYRYAIFTVVVGALLWSSYLDYSGNKDLQGPDSTVIAEYQANGADQNTVIDRQAKEPALLSELGTISNTENRSHNTSHDQVVAQNNTNRAEATGRNNLQISEIPSERHVLEGQSPMIIEVDNMPLVMDPDDRNNNRSDSNKEPEVSPDNANGESGDQNRVIEVVEPVLAGVDQLEEDGETAPKTDKVIGSAPIRRYSLEFFYAPLYASRTLVGNDNNLISARNASENVRYSYSTGVRFNYELNETWDVQLGLEYNRRNERVEYATFREEVEMDVISRTVVYKHPVLPDRVVTITDTAYNSYSIRTDHESYNKYSSITVPLLVRPTVYYRNFGFYANAGIKLSVWNKQTGHVVNSSLEFQDVNNGVYSQKTLVPSLQVGAGAMYRLSDRWSVIAESMNVWGLKPVTSGEYSLDQYDKYYGLILGTRLNF